MTRRRIRRGGSSEVADPDVVQTDPDFNTLTVDEAVAYLIETYGTSESHARFMISIERGLIEGCCVEVSDQEIEDETAAGQ